MPAPPIELILTVLLNRGFCQRARLGVTFDNFDARGPVTDLINVWITEVEDIEAVYASPTRPQPNLCIGAWNSIRPPA